MATLFFDGFDRATVIQKLDSQYWSTQYKNPGYPRYAFGGYSYNNDSVSVDNSYDARVYRTFSVNNGTVPNGTFYNGQIGNFNSYYIQDNSYPGFGTPPGFLALTNVAINDIYNLEPLAYIQLSGFPAISGNKSYFGIRTLGIETKHSDYWDSDYPLGRFGNKHPFLAFCSGNTTGLLLSFVKISGDHLLPLKFNNPPSNTGVRVSIGLQVEQQNGVSGIFDLNISDSLANYRVTPPHCGNGSFFPDLSNPCKILTIAKENSFIGPDGNTATISRWVHFEFEIDHISGIIKTKVEGVDAPVENTDVYIERENWNISINIQPFLYDNIRLFNRTYQTGLLNCGWTYSYPSEGAQNASYYLKGAVTLYDDITLVDNTGNTPTYYLGPDSKVLPIHPGFNGSLGTNAGSSDGLLQWDKNTSSARRALASLDKDSSIIFTDRPNQINAIAYSDYNTLPQLDYDGVGADVASFWRVTPNDGIGGLKIYNSARKNFLDSSFINVFQTGISDIHRESVVLLLHAEENPVRDYSKYAHGISHNNAVTIVNNHKFGLSGAMFDSSIENSYLVVNTDKHPGLFQPFTLESWIYFTGLDDTIVLMDTRHRLLPEIDASDIDIQRDWYSICCTPNHIQIEKSFFGTNPSQDNYGSNPVGGARAACGTTAKLLLPFSQPATTGVWHHVALTKQIVNESGWYTAYLNGVSGTQYKKVTIPKYSTIDTIFPYWNNGQSIKAYSCTNTVTTDYISGVLPLSIVSNPWINPHGVRLDASGDVSVFGALDAEYFSVVDTVKTYPYMYIGYSGLIDEYRYSLNVCRYYENFIVPSTGFKAHYDDYLRFGPVHTADRSLYKLYQFYQIDNPSTNLPWTSGQIFTSGLILGVEKL